MITAEFARTAGTQTLKLDKPIPMGSFTESNAVCCTHIARVWLEVGNDKCFHTFLIAPVEGDPQIFLGRPWARKRCPEILELFENFGKQTPKNLRLSGGGVFYIPNQREETRKEHSCNPHTCLICRKTQLKEILREKEWQEGRAERLRILFTTLDAIQDAEETLQEGRILRAAVEGNAGVRGLGGNKEGWEASIPEEFRRYNPTVFSDKPLRFDQIRRPEFEVVLKLKDGEQLQKRKPYELQPHQLRNLRQLIEQEVATGVYTRSMAPHAAPVFFVTDPGSKQERLVVDYRELNAKMDRNAYPLPRINTILEWAADRLAGSTEKEEDSGYESMEESIPVRTRNRANRGNPGKDVYISIFDIRSAFQNLPLARESRSLTAFVTPFGSFEYNVMPMGLGIAPSVWQRYADTVFAPLLHEAMKIYVDDAIIISHSREDHVRHVEQFLGICEREQLRIKPHKAHFFKKEVEFLGFKLSAGKGIRMLEDKLQGIREWPAPRGVRDLRGFLGLIGFYQNYILHFSDLCAPLTDLLKKEAVWDWTPERERAFLEIKRRFSQDVFLSSFQPWKKTQLATDASDVAFGGVIEQQDEEGNWRPLIMFSQKFKDAEKNWDTADKELFAIVHAFRKYGKWLGCTEEPILVRSDHRNLTKFLFSTNLLKSHDGRLGRWALELAPHNFIIEYLEGEKNVVPDALSRYGLEESVDLPASQLLPAARFTKKTLARIDDWFRQEKDYQGIRKRLEASFSSRHPRDNLPLREVWAEREQKLNDSELPSSSLDPRARMAGPQRKEFGERYRTNHPEASMVEVPKHLIRQGKDTRGLGSA